MAETNVFVVLRDALNDLKQFLDDNVAEIKPAIQGLAGIIPQINNLLADLSNLLAKLKTEIEGLDITGIPGVTEASTFASRSRAFLEAARALLPGDTDTIDTALDVTGVVSGILSLDSVKTDIIAFIDAVIVHLNTLRAP